jgi:hypothetical protein
VTTVVVGTDDLRRALRSVAPHADPDPDFAPLHRVRLEVGPVNLTVSATNRYTVGHALVSILDNEDGDQLKVDLSPLDVKEILGLFKTHKDTPDDSLRLEVDEELLVVTDVSGLFSSGKALSLPRIPFEENYGDIEKLLHVKLTKDTGADAVSRLITNGDLLGLFTHAAKAYSEPLVLEPTGTRSSILISCGESFIGLLMPIGQDDETAARINGWHSDWLTRLGDSTSGYAPRGGDPA